MRIIFTAFAVLAVLVVSLTCVFAQTTGDYRSNGTGGGNWSVGTTWQKYNGSSWIATGTPPTGAETTTILSTDSVYINVAVAVTGTIVNQGILSGGSNLTIASGGTYQHDRDAGSIPLCTWSTGSTLLITGVTGTAPNNRNQSFYNMTFNTLGLLSNLSMSLDSVTIGGNVTVLNSSAARWYLTTALAGDSGIVSIMGDVIVSGGSFSSNGTGNANTKFVINQYGNINVTGGNFSVSRGSQGSGTGSTRWYLHNGNFSMSNAITQNSNPTNAWFVFDKAGTQTLTLGTGNTLTALPIVVMGGTTLNMGLSQLSGSGLFTLNAGATLATATPGGLDSAIFVTGTVMMDTGASFIFYGSAAQITGLTMPATVNNLVINNAAGVTLSRTTTINGELRLVAGIFDNTIPFTLGPSGSISFEGGSLLHSVSVKSEASSVPRTFFVNQNYPNPFNPSTTIRYGLPHESFVSVRVFNVLGQEVAILIDGRQDAGIHAVVFDASSLGSGVYLCRIQYGSIVETKRMMLVK